MLTDEVTRRLNAAADEQPFQPDVAPVLQRARRLHRRRRAWITGGIAAFCAVALAGGLAVVESTPNASGTLADADAQPQAALPVTITTTYDQANDVTCAVLTFTETGDTIDAGCSRLSSDEQAKGIVSSGDFGKAHTRTGEPETTIALGELAGGGTVEITDDTGRKIRAAILAPPTGYPYSVYYADLGTGPYWPAHITYSAPNGTKHTYNIATPAPSATTIPK